MPLITNGVFRLCLLWCRASQCMLEGNWGSGNFLMGIDRSKAGDVFMLRA